MTKTIRFGVAGIAMFAALGLGSTAHAQDTATNPQPHSPHISNGQH